ncbi:hypothetical protein RRU01S_13_00070 [Agrobacterium rubi TR3 = NBRC 13261]|uniref:Uncharacterized protein n=2 Tax=Agrobacterium rubi TaxID=28099 RepID=A0A081CVH3_9HYPH|nr:hypothetical protein RRU01S_13_00070 [Agrobacterium rubi TR3 = NBRC 13261]
MAAMWETVVFSGLSKCGVLDHEVALVSGRRPDIRFSSADLTFVADVTCVSDSGLDEQNPYRELMRLLSEAQARLGLPSGGLDLKVRSQDVVSRRGKRRVLRLPPKNKLPEFIRDEIVPSLRTQIEEKASPLRVVIDDGGAGLEITINPDGSQYTTGSYAPYSFPTIKDQNPLFNALKQKAGQLRGSKGITGVIVGDGDCGALSSNRLARDTVPAEDIARDFLRQYSSVDFVLMIAVQDDIGSIMPLQHVNSLKPILVTRDNGQLRQQLAHVFERMLSDFPKPVESAVNGALRAAEAGYDLGLHGGSEVGGNKIRVSAREMMEVLAGMRTFDDRGALNIEAAREAPEPPSRITTAFLGMLATGRLPSKMTVIRTGDDESDHWVEFEFDQADPAISPFRWSKG